jgi:hypothetical protein
MHIDMTSIPYSFWISIDGSIGVQEQKSQRCLFGKPQSPTTMGAPGLDSETWESKNAPEDE